MVRWEQKGPVENLVLGVFRGLLLGYRPVHLLFRGLHCVLGILGRIKQLVHWEQTGRVGEQQQGGEIEFPVIIVAPVITPVKKYSCAISSRTVIRSK